MLQVVVKVVARLQVGGGGSGHEETRRVKVTARRTDLPGPLPGAGGRPRTSGECVIDLSLYSIPS